jgi:hypothetical protein
MYNYLIVIPSYKRPELIKTHTLKVLENYKISPIKIFIFVANKTEYKYYIHSLDKKYHKNIIIGKKGLKNQRNYISSYFPENSKIVQLDDDIKSINQLTHYNIKNRKENKLNSISNLDKFIKEAFKQSLKNNSYLWGVYPVNNPYFMFPKMTTDLRFITGPMFGIINRHSSKLKLTIDEKEDTQRSLQYFTLDKTIIRFNNITIETSYYKNKGGMQEEKKDRKIEALKSAQYLIKKYPTLTKLNLTKKSGFPEVKLLNKN